MAFRPLRNQMDSDRTTNLSDSLRDHKSLDDVLSSTSGTALKEFVASLRWDLSAVQAALDLPWTISPTEGQISRLKILKRTMYGRAGFNLLRARVPHAP
jgi:transposase